MRSFTKLKYIFSTAPLAAFSVSSLDLNNKKHVVCYEKVENEETDFKYNSKKKKKKKSKEPAGMVSVYASQGQRPGMEDFYVTSEDGRFFAIFDGHGGESVSKYCETKATKYLKREDSCVQDCLQETYSNISEEVLDTEEFDFEGTCAVSIYLTENQIISANIGDSRAIMCRGGVAFDLTIDHKPNLPSELKRIEDLGGQVTWDGYLGPDRQPVLGMGAWRVNDTLAVSRAIGDKLDQPFISSEPDIFTLDKKQGADTFIVLASDGLWDVISSEECVKFVNQILRGSVGALEDDDIVRRPMMTLNQWVKNYKNDRNMVRAVMDSRKSKMAQFLVEESLRRGSEDNVTVIVIWLK